MHSLLHLFVCLWCSATCLRLALLVLLHRLAWMVGHIGPVATILPVILEDVGVVPRLDAEALQAAADEAVLAARAHEGVLADGLVRATVGRVVVGEVHVHGPPAEDLDGPQHGRLRVAVVDAPRLAGRQVGDVLLQPVGEKRGVRVHLHDPVVVPELPRPQNGVPGLGEDLRVQPGAPLPFLGCEVSDGRGSEAATEVEAPVAVDCPLFALEQAQAVSQLVLDQLGLWARRHRQSPAEERRMRTAAGIARSQLVASPSRLVGVACVDSWGTPVHASRPSVILLEALLARAAAAHCGGTAASAAARAVCGHPLCERSLRWWYAGCSWSKLCAIPRAGVHVIQVRARLATRPAPSPHLVLSEARHARLAAA
mmetsp:Transcript_2404/g.4821  ORF Transcript_2404/g.4821 Transcript_2404/m.4821 type:complete len:369 (-) Transcript_2404:785-1891(-)